MEETVNDTVSEEVSGDGAGKCKCEQENCDHGTFTKHRGEEEIALAFLLALTPLTVLTFFGQLGLL